MRVMTSDLEALNHAGFIDFSASNPASNLAGLEVEREVERELEAAAGVLGSAHHGSADSENKNERTPLSELAELLDDLDIAGPLRQQALADPKRALHAAHKTLAANPRNKPGYFRKVLESTGQIGTANRPQRENAYIRDSPERIRTLIRNGVIWDPADLEAELSAIGLNGDTADELRSLIAVTSDNGRLPFSSNDDAELWAARLADEPDHEEL
jgi:hypothetical protein